MACNSFHAQFHERKIQLLRSVYYDWKLERLRSFEVERQSMPSNRWCHPRPPTHELVALHETRSRLRERAQKNKASRVAEHISLQQ
jgi:hypothetical protein